MNLLHQMHGSLDVRQALLYHDNNAQFLYETWQLFLAIHAEDSAKFRHLVESGCLEEAMLLVHSLKNIAALIGAEGLRQACIVAESRVKQGMMPSISELTDVKMHLAETLEDAQTLVTHYHQQS